MYINQLKDRNQYLEAKVTELTLENKNWELKLQLAQAQNVRQNVAKKRKTYTTAQLEEAVDLVLEGNQSTRKAAEKVSTEENYLPAEAVRLEILRLHPGHFQRIKNDKKE